MEWDHQQLLVCVLSVLHDPQLRAGLLARVPHMEQFRAQTPGEVGVTPYGVSKLIRLAATTLKESPEKTKGQKLAVDKKSNAPTKPKRCRKESAHDEVREKKQMRRNVDHMPAAAAAKPPQSTSPVPDSAKKPSPDERGERMCKNCGAKFLPGVENQNCCQYHKGKVSPPPSRCKACDVFDVNAGDPSRRTRLNIDRDDNAWRGPHRHREASLALLLPGQRRRRVRTRGVTRGSNQRDHGDGPRRGIMGGNKACSY